MARLPFDGNPRVTCDNACHQRRKPPSTGDDWGMTVGTNLYAPFDGTARFYSAGAGGWTVTVTATDPRLQGLQVHLMHLSSAVGLSLGQSRPVREGEHIAESGGAKGHPGAGNSTGPHLHSHSVLGGTRIPTTEAIAWANQQTPPTPDTFEDETMNASYLFAPAASGKPARYILCGIQVPGGSYVTTNVAEAEAMGFVYGQQSGNRVGAPIREITQAQLDNAVALYAKLHAQWLAEQGAGGGASPQQIAQAVDAQLKDDFAGVRADVNKPRTLQ